jgi:hypothetical protein
MVIIPAQQLADIVAVMTAKAVREELDRREASAVTNPAAELPDEVPAKQAAKVCGYATQKSLVKWHGKHLTPIRNGKRLFYGKKEVLKLKSLLFNQL